MPRSGEPVPAGLYCQSCRYELRGLLEYRCPECGREFDPGRPETVSVYATRKLEMLAAVDHTVAVWLSKSRAEPDRVATARLAAHVAHLIAENTELRSNLGALARLLVEKGLISEAELHERLDHADLLKPVDSQTEDQILRWLEGAGTLGNKST